MPTIVASAINSALYTDFDTGHVIEDFFFGTSDASFWLDIVISIVFQCFAIYLVIIWSRQHNRQFESQTTNP